MILREEAVLHADKVLALLTRAQAEGLDGEDCVVEWDKEVALAVAYYIAMISGSAADTYSRPDRPELVVVDVQDVDVEEQSR